MSRSIFGWSYPAGCSGPPDDDLPISDLEDAVLQLLEDAAVPTEINDKIMKLISDWQRSSADPPEPHLPPFKVWSYQRPVGHSKSSAVRRGHAPMVTEWAYAPLSADGESYKISQTVSGFASEEAATTAALAQPAKTEGS